MTQTSDNFNPAELPVKRRENVALGALGALLFSLAGVVVYYLLYQMGYVASLSGIVAIAAAYFGYGLFSGNKTSKKGLVFAGIFAVLAMIVAEYLCIAKELYDSLGAELGDFGYVPTIGDALSAVMQRLQGNGVVDLTESGGRISLVWGDYGDQAEVLGEVLKELGMALLFCALGIGVYIHSVLTKRKAAEKAQKEQAAQAEQTEQKNPVEF